MQSIKMPSGIIAIDEPIKLLTLAEYNAIKNKSDRVYFITDNDRKNVIRIFKSGIELNHYSASQVKLDPSGNITKTNVQDAIIENDSHIKSTNINLNNHASNTSNPHKVTKTQVGLGNVDNTSDINKPVSTAQKKAIDAVNTSLTIHAENTIAHITAAERTEWNSKAAGVHIHDDRYYTESEMNNKLSGKVDLSETGMDIAINKLTEGMSVPVDDDYYIAQYAGGGTTTTTYHRRPIKKLWEYIKSKLAGVATSGSYNDLSNKPTIGDGTVTIIQDGTSKGTFTMNQTGNTTITLTDNNTDTWRGIQNNLTSDSTSDSLSAAQGKKLKELVDDKADGDHAHSTASGSSAGFMSAADKSTLDILEFRTQNVYASIGGNSSGEIGFLMPPKSGASRFIVSVLFLNGNYSSYLTWYQVRVSGNYMYACCRNYGAGTWSGRVKASCLYMPDSHVTNRDDNNW